MSVTHTIVGDRLYTVVDDITSSYRAVITGALIDENTGQPLDVVATLSGGLPGMLMRVTDGSLIVGAANTDLVLPKLASTPYSFSVLINAPGYRPTTLPITIPAGSLLPFPAPTVRMRPVGIRFQGRVVKARDRSPVPNATIAIKNTSNLLLRTPVRFAHNLGVTVNAVALSNTGPARQVKEDIGRGATRVILDNNGALAPGAHLQFSTNIAAEIYEVGAVGPDAGEVQIVGGLASTFTAGTPVQAVNASAPTASANLLRSCDPGDGVLIVSAALTNHAIEISDGTQSELHWLNALSDANGYYRANGVAGVKALELLCSAGGFTTADQGWFPVYSNPVNVIDFRLTP